MYQFFIEDENAAEDFVTIEGSDVNHIKNVLRMKPGEKIRVCTRNGQLQNIKTGTRRSVL